MGGKRKQRVAVLRAVKPPRVKKEPTSVIPATNRSQRRQEAGKKQNELQKEGAAPLSELKSAQEKPESLVSVAQPKSNKRKKQAPKDDDIKEVVAVDQNKQKKGKESESKLEDDSVLISKFHVLQKRLCQANGVSVLPANLSILEFCRTRPKRRKSRKKLRDWEGCRPIRVHRCAARPREGSTHPRGCLNSW